MTINGVNPKVINEFAVHPKNFANSHRSLKEYKEKQTGMYSCNIADMGGFVKSSEELDQPDCQFHYTSLPILNGGRDLSAVLIPGICLHACQLQPTSVGHVKIKSLK
eukprot:UN29160